jgi:Zn-finger nucleic acid-binding protein
MNKKKTSVNTPDVVVGRCPFCNIKITYANVTNYEEIKCPSCKTKIGGRSKLK